MSADLSFSQLEQLWTQAGGAPSMAPLMAAIALAESSGNPDSVNATDNNGTQTSWGLWQISNGTHNPPSPDILSPLGNAKAAVGKVNSQGLTAWGTYTSGAYRQYLPAGASFGGPQLTAAAPGAATAGGGQGGAPYAPSIVPGIPASAPSFPDFTANPYNELSRVLSWTSEFGGWAIFTLLVLLFGAVLLLLGAAMLVVLLAAPVADPVAEVAGGFGLGRLTGRTQSRARSAGRSIESGAPAVDDVDTGRHVARGRHAPGGSQRTRAPEAVRRHNRMIEAEDRDLMAESRASAPVRRAHSQAERRATNARRRSRDTPPRRDRSQLTRPRAG